MEPGFAFILVFLKWNKEHQRNDVLFLHVLCLWPAGCKQFESPRWWLCKHRQGLGPSRRQRPSPTPVSPNKENITRPSNEDHVLMVGRSPLEDGALLPLRPRVSGAALVQGAHVHVCGHFSHTQFTALNDSPGRPGQHRD